jgi:hypothetical protein
MNEKQWVVPVVILFGLIVFWLIASDPPPDPAPTDNTASPLKVVPHILSPAPTIRLRHPGFPAPTPPLVS